MEQEGHSLPAEFARLQAPSSAYAPRQVVTYLCTREHLVPVPFAAGVEPPEVWDCRCGQPATRVAGDAEGSGESQGNAPVDQDEANSAAAE